MSQGPNNPRKPCFYEATSTDPLRGSLLSYPGCSGWDGNDCCARCSTASSVSCLNSLTQKDNLTKATEWRPWQFRAIQDTHGLILTLMHSAFRVPGWDCIQQVHQMGKVRKGFCGSREHTPSSGNEGGTKNNPVSTQSTQGGTYRSHRPRIGVRKAQSEKPHK